MRPCPARGSPVTDEIERRDLDAARIESGIGGAGMAQDANERRAEHDEQDATRDLADHERAPQPRAARTIDRTPSLSDVPASTLEPLKAGSTPKTTAAPIESDRAKSSTRQSSVRGTTIDVGSGGRSMRRQPHQHTRQANAEQAAEEKQHERLGQQLTDEASTRRRRAPRGAPSPARVPSPGSA